MVVLASRMEKTSGDKSPHSNNSFGSRNVIPKTVICSPVSLLLASVVTFAAADDLGEHGFSDSDGVKIHYVTKGDGPLLLMLHGFPDYWYTWRKQIPAISEHFQVVAIDL
jgi:hypothetical protein